MSEAREDTPRAGWEAEGLARSSSLDGIRAFAVLAVLCFHGGVSWMGGGLLGVDVFFVLSGFLITSLLCRELQRTNVVRLGRFWARRARRLLPALFVLLLGIALYGVLYRNSLDLGSLRGDALSTLFYFANWHFVFAHQGYFAQSAAPSPLLHTWSLAVEEQYYLIWPLITFFVVRRFGKRAYAATAGVLALASAVVMGGLYASGVSLDRLYYGTDTRAQALLVGSFLGALGAHRGTSFTIVPDRWRGSRRANQLWTLLGLVGAGYLVWAWHSFDGQDPSLYRGGFLLVALAAGGVIVACVTVPTSRLSRFLSLPAIVFIGRISYGLYLYHWPIFLAVDHAHTGLSGFWLLALRFAIAFGVATLSFVLVEEPIRTHRLFRGTTAFGVTSVTAGLTAAVVVLATVAPTAGAAPTRIVPLPPSERQALTATDAFTVNGNPIRFLLLGDSIAYTLGVGLAQKTVSHYGVRLIGFGIPGCDLDVTEVRNGGKTVPGTPQCAGWPSKFEGAVRGLQPEVVGVLLGRWEVSDHFWEGHWVHVGDPAWDEHLKNELVELSEIVSSEGASVVFLTCPYVDPPESLNGSRFSENDPSRIRAWNRIVSAAAGASSRSVTVVDLNKMLDPQGQYQGVVSGYTVRFSDGIHISKAGGELVQAAILPQVVQLGLHSRVVHGPFPSIPPPALRKIIYLVSASFAN